MMDKREKEAQYKAMENSTVTTYSATHLPYSGAPVESAAPKIERFTEYHYGVAVIKDKSFLSAAMKKLARYEDMEEASRRKK